ncbi:monooxygenase [Pseudomonadota bacterium]
MQKLLQFDFPHAGPWGEDLTAAFTELAESIAHEPGFIWKIWTENVSEGIAGGIYLFENEETALAYKAKHEQRLASFGVTQIRTKIFDVNTALSKILRSPL